MTNSLQPATYRIGRPTTPVEQLLEMRTRADQAAPAASAQLSGQIRLDAPIVVTGLAAGPTDADGDLVMAIDSEHGLIGRLLISAGTLNGLADLIMGGRGVPEDRVPTDLEVELVATRMLDSIATISEAVAPSLPAAVALDDRAFDFTGRSTVVSLSVEHRDTAFTFRVDLLDQHVEGGGIAGEDELMEAICGEVPVELNLRFQPTRLPAREIEDLVPGDVICLDHELGAPLIGEVDGRALLLALPGLSRRSVAVQITDLLEGSK